MGKSEGFILLVGLKQTDLNPLLVQASVWWTYLLACTRFYMCGQSIQWNAFATKLSSLDLLCVLQYFFLLLFNHLPTYREVRGRGKLIYEVPCAKRGGGVSNHPSAMQLVWWMGHFVMRCFGEYGEMFMLLLFPTNAAATFQIYYWNGYRQVTMFWCCFYLPDVQDGATWLDMDWHLEILYSIYKLHEIQNFLILLTF